MRRLLFLCLLLAIVAAACDSPTRPDDLRDPPPLQHSLATGNTHACVLDEEGAAWCWGANGVQQLGVARAPETCERGIFCSRAPIPVETPERFTLLVAAQGYTCGLTRGGAAVCWGILPGGSSWPSPAPTRVAGELGFATLAAGYDGLCGTTVDGASYCWGRQITGYDNPHLPTTIFRQVPRRLESAPPFVELTVGIRHGCGLTRDGSAYCWGSNEFGELGTNDASEGCWYHRGHTTVCRTTPALVGGGLKFRSISVPSAHQGAYTCGVSLEGALYCWGRMAHDGPSYGPNPTRVMPERRFRAVSSDSWRTCAIAESGPTYCWGSGMLGNGLVHFRYTEPLEVTGGLSFVTLRLDGVACGLTASRDAYCWGWNDYGQLGAPGVCSGSCAILSPVRVADRRRRA